MGFTERSTAFDFNAALADHAKYVKQRKEEAKNLEKLKSAPKLNLALAEGQTITVNIKVNKPSNTSTNKSSSSSSTATGILPPPPGSRSQQTTSQPSNQQPQIADPFSNFDFGDFNGGNQQQNQNFNFDPFQTTATQQNVSNDPFDIFMSKPSQSAQQQQQPAQQQTKSAANLFDWTI